MVGFRQRQQNASRPESKEKHGDFINLYIWVGISFVDISILILYKYVNI